jgi:nicotinamidase-related amidase
MQTMSAVLLVIDVQQGLFALPQPLYRGEEVLHRIALLLRRARDGGSGVIHVRHDGGAGHALEKGTAGWFHHPMVAPRDPEIIIDKHRSSAFHHTDLQVRLAEMGARSLIICGVQTEMCVDSTIRAAVGLDYQVTLVANAHTTYDTPIITAEQIVAHHNRIWARSFAKLAPAEEVDMGTGAPS